MTIAEYGTYWDKIIGKVTERPTINISRMAIEPEAEYHAKAGEYLSSHLLAEFIRCPYGYHKVVTGKMERADTPAYRFGRAAHKLILEGDLAFSSVYAVGGPVNLKTGNPYGQETKAWADWEVAEGKVGLTEEQYVVMRHMQEAVYGNKRAAILLRGDGAAERVARANYAGCMCQSRFDYVHPQNGIVDLKTCDDLTWFEADAKRFGYVRQMAFYQAVLETVTGVRATCHIIAVEKKEPFRCGVWEVEEASLDIARQENVVTITRLLECREKNYWPTGYEEVRTLAS